MNFLKTSCFPGHQEHCVPATMTSPRTVAPPRSHPKDISLINGAGPFYFFVSQLKVDVGVPGLLLRLPFHPALKHLPRPSNVPQHLLHVGVLVPSTESQSLTISGSCFTNDVSFLKVKVNEYSFILKYQSDTLIFIF